MGNTDKRGLRRAAAVLALLVGVVAALLATSTSALADDEYAQEKVVTYPILELEGNAQPACTATTFIGQTTANAIEASTTVDCTREVITPLQLRGYVGITAGSITPVAASDDGCFGCEVYTVSTSVPRATPGTRYCATGVANVGLTLTDGKDSVCITT